MRQEAVGRHRECDEKATQDRLIFPAQWKRQEER